MMPYDCYPGIPAWASMNSVEIPVDDVGSRFTRRDICDYPFDATAHFVEVSPAEVSPEALSFAANALISLPVRIERQRGRQ